MALLLQVLFGLEAAQSFINHRDRHSETPVQAAAEFICSLTQCPGRSVHVKWVTDHDEVPFGPLTCFSGAVYDVDWSGITDSPVEVTFSFDLEPDEGAEP